MTTDIEQALADEIISECQEAYKGGSKPLVQLVAAKQQKATVIQRANYMLAGIETIATLDIDALRCYFEALGRHIPEDEQAPHQEALVIVLEEVMDKLMEHAAEHARAIQAVMGLSEQYEIQTGTTRELEPVAHPMDPSDPFFDVPSEIITLH